MSFSMYARPKPIDPPEPESFRPLKYALSQRYWGHDGSLKGSIVVLKPTDETTSFLWGIEAAAGEGSEMALEAKQLRAMLHDNPQGVELWIGEEEDGD